MYLKILFLFYKIGDDEAEEEDKALRRVNTVLTMSSVHRDSFSKFGPIEPFKKTDIGLTMDPPKPGFWRRFLDLLDVTLYLKTFIFSYCFLDYHYFMWVK